MADLDTALHWNDIVIPPSEFLNEKIRGMITGGSYEQEEIAGALHVIRPEDRVLEMGAGLGIVGSVIGRHAAPARLVAYEANPMLIPFIEEAYDKNGLTGTHAVRNALLMSDPDAPASLPFNVHVSYLGSSLSDTGTRTRKTVDVPTEQFSQIRSDLDPTVLVMDIEGGEDPFLRHADLSGVRAIVIEFHPEYYGRLGTLRCKWRLLRAGFRPIRAYSHSTVWTCQRTA